MPRSFVEKLEKFPVSPAHALLAAAFTGVVRHLLELAVTGTTPPLGENLRHLLDSITFYAFLLLCFLAGQKLFLRRISAAPIALGFVLAFLPPILDVFIYESPRYFYPIPHLLFMVKGITAGELFAVYGAIIIFAAYVALSRKSAAFAAYAAIFAWAVLQVFGSIHPMISFILEQRLAATMDGLILIPTRLAMMLIPLAYVDDSFSRFMSYRGSRILLFLSLSIFSISSFAVPLPAALPLLVANVSAAAIAYMLNSKGDEVEDKENRRRTPHPGPFAWASIIFIWAAASAFVLISNSSLFSFTPIAMAALAFAYSSPIKVKRHFPAAYILEGAVFTLCFISYPAAVLPQQPLLLPAAACFIVFTGGVMVKDYKDEPGDRKAGINTIFTVLEGKPKEAFWSAFRVLLITVPPLFVLFEKGASSPLSIGAAAAFMLGSAFMLFLAKTKKEDVVDSYIWLFSALLLVSSFA